MYRDDIIDDLMENYSKSSLQVLLNYMGIQFKESQNKLELINSVCDGLTNKETFNKFFSKLTPEARKVVEHLTWDGISTLNHIESLNHIKITLDDYYGNTKDPFIKNFKSSYTKYILFSTGLRALLKKGIKRPDYKKCELTNFIKYTDLGIVENICAIIDFIESENINERDFKLKILVRTYKKFEERFNLEHIYSNKIIEIILKFLQFQQSQNNNYQTLEYLFNNYKSGKLSAVYNIDEYLFLNNVKGFSNNRHLDIFFKRGRYSILNRIRSYDTREWIDIDAFVREISLDEETQIFDTTYFGDLLSTKGSPGIKLDQKYSNEEFLINPLVCGAAMFLYSFGCSDLMYADKNFSKITHFKLTSLGCKIMGLPSDYVIKEEKQFSFEFNSIIKAISTPEENISGINFLEDIGDKIGSGLYLTTHESLFRNCNSREDCEKKLEKVEEIAPKNLPIIWENFIESAYNRICPIYNEQNLIVINFPKGDKEFIDLVVNNRNIRKLYSMVEGFRGAFTPENYIQFKKNMKEKGYFL